MPTTRASPNLCEGNIGIPFGGDPGWVRTNGSPDPDTPFVEARGQVLPDLNYKTNPFVTHTDAPFNHYSHDINVFVTLDEPFRHLLASGNFVFEDMGDPIGVENEHSMIEMEWERSGVPLFAYPAQSDRMTAWGPHVWDCGHGEAAHRLRHATHRPVWSARRTARRSIRPSAGCRSATRPRQRPRPGAAGRQE